MTLGGHPVAALDRAVHERRPAQRGVRAGEVHAALGRAQRAPGRCGPGRGAAPPRCRGCRGRRPSRARARRRPRPRARARRTRPRPPHGRRRRAPRPTARSRRARVLPSAAVAIAAGVVELRAAREREEVVGDAAREHPDLHALPRVVLRRGPRLRSDPSGGSKAIPASAPIGAVTTTASARSASPAAVVTVDAVRVLRDRARPASRARISPRTSPGDRLVQGRRPVAEAPARARRPRDGARPTSRRRRSSGGTRAWRRRRPGAEPQAAIQRSASSRTRPPTPCASSHAEAGTSRSSRPCASGGSAGSWRRAAASSAATTRSSSPRSPVSTGHARSIRSPAEHPAHPRGERVVLARPRRSGRPPPRRTAGSRRPRRRPCRDRARRARRAAPTRGRRSGRAPPAPSPCSRAPRAHGRRRGR